MKVKVIRPALLETILSEFGRRSSHAAVLPVQPRSAMIEVGGPRHAARRAQEHLVALVIGLLTTLVILAQNQASALVFMWALIHGAGIGSAVAFVPAAIAIAALWGSYIVLKRRNVRRMTGVFSACAVAVLAANEVVLPATPLKVMRNGSYARRVQIRNARDEVLRSSGGSPMGVRIMFDAVVPHTGPYSISMSVMVPAGGNAPSALSLAHSPKIAIAPEPERDENGSSIFEEGQVYRFTQDMLPQFVGYDARSSTPSLRDPTTRFLSWDQFQAALEAATAVHYRGEIHVDEPVSGDRVVLVDYVTTHPYDVRAVFLALSPGR